MEKLETASRLSLSRREGGSAGWRGVMESKRRTPQPLSLPPSFPPLVSTRLLKSEAACFGAAPSRCTITPRRWLARPSPSVRPAAAEEEGGGEKKNPLHLFHKVKIAAVFKLPLVLSLCFLVLFNESSSVKASPSPGWLLCTPCDLNG